MRIERSKLEGRVVVMLNSLTPKPIENYIEEIKNDGVEFYMNNSNKFLGSYLLSTIFQTEKKHYLSPEDVMNDPEFISKYRVRYNRLKIFMSGMYYFLVEHTTKSLKEIMEFAGDNKISRILVFPTKNLVGDYLKTIEIFKLNTFLSYMDFNYIQSKNLYSMAGFIRKKRLENLFKGKGSGVNDFTFKTLKLELDWSLNTTPIHYLKTDEWEKVCEELSFPELLPRLVKTD